GGFLRGGAGGWAGGSSAWTSSRRSWSGGGAVATEGSLRGRRCGAGVRVGEGRVVDGGRRTGQGAAGPGSRPGDAIRAVHGSVTSVLTRVSTAAPDRASSRSRSSAA